MEAKWIFPTMGTASSRCPYLPQGCPAICLWWGEFPYGSNLWSFLHWDLALSRFFYIAEASSCFCRQFTLFRHRSRATHSLPQGFWRVPHKISLATVLHLNHLNEELGHLEQISCKTLPPTLHLSHLQFTLTPPQPLSNQPLFRSEQSAIFFLKKLRICLLHFCTKRK